MKGPNEILPFDHPAIIYPQLASTKMDGFRLLNYCGEQLVSPALKPFPNQEMNEHLKELLQFCKVARIVTDGEFWSPECTFQELQSIVRSHNKPIPDHVKYYIFDTMSEENWNNGTEMPFICRYLEAMQTMNFGNCIPVEHYYMMNSTEAQDKFDAAIEAGEEGIILRQPTAKYKHGRTTENQDGMWKFKEFVTHDAVIVGFEQAERMRDGIARTMDAQGKLERTYRQEDYTPIDMVGAFIVENVPFEGGIGYGNTSFSGSPKQFKVKPGKGHDNEWKRCAWYQRLVLMGKHVEYRYMPHGTLNKPRIGSLVRMRPDLD